jgi:hypothetical protein
VSRIAADLSLLEASWGKDGLSSGAKSHHPAAPSNTSAVAPPQIDMGDNFLRRFFVLFPFTNHPLCPRPPPVLPSSPSASSSSLDGRFGRSRSLAPREP